MAAGHLAATNLNPPFPPLEEIEKSTLPTKNRFQQQPNHHLVFGSLHEQLILQQVPRQHFAPGLPSLNGDKPTLKSYAEVLTGNNTFFQGYNHHTSVSKVQEEPIHGICNQSIELKPTATYLGKPSVLFTISDKQSLIKRLNYVLVAKFSHGRPDLASVKEFIFSLNLKGNCNISVFDSKHLFLECDTFGDFVSLWMKRACTVKGFLMRLFKWREDFHPSIESPLCPIWVHLPGLPLYLYQEEALLSIANAIGKPLVLDLDNVNRSKLGCASFCVEVDVSAAVIDKLWIYFAAKKPGIDGKGFWQKVHYDVMPPFCSGCEHLGHPLEHCMRIKNIDKVIVKEANAKQDGFLGGGGIAIEGISGNLVVKTGEPAAVGIYPAGEQTALHQISAGHQGDAAVKATAKPTTAQESQEAIAHEGLVELAPQQHQAGAFELVNAGLAKTAGALRESNGAGKAAAHDLFLQQFEMVDAAGHQMQAPIPAADISSDKPGRLCAVYKSSAAAAQQEICGPQRVADEGLVLDTICNNITAKQGPNTQGKLQDGYGDHVQQTNSAGFFNTNGARLKEYEAAGEAFGHGDGTVATAGEQDIHRDAAGGYSATRKLQETEQPMQDSFEKRQETDDHSTSQLGQIGLLHLVDDLQVMLGVDMAITAQENTDLEIECTALSGLEITDEKKECNVVAEEEHRPEVAKDAAENARGILAERQGAIGQPFAGQKIATDKTCGRTGAGHVTLTESAGASIGVGAVLVEEEGKQDIRITSQLSPSEVKDCAKKELAKAYFTPTSSLPSLTNLRIPDKDGNAVPIYEILEKSARMSELSKDMVIFRNMNESLKGEHGLDVLKTTEYYDSFLTWYTIAILQTLKDHSLTSFNQDSTTDKVTPPDQDVIKKDLDDEEWTTPNRRGRDRNKKKKKKKRSNN